MSRLTHQAGAYPGFRSMKRLGIFLLPLDGMLVHRRVTPSIKFAGTHLYTWVKRGTVRVKCLAHEHNAMSSARSRTRTARSGVERTNYEATAPPTVVDLVFENLASCFFDKNRISKSTFALYYSFSFSQHSHIARVIRVAVYGYGSTAAL